MAAEKTGILLVNLGSPEAPTTRAVRRFLKEFLWDPRVVNIPRPLWWLILHLFVLPLRPSRSAKAYQKIWTEDGSPLVALTRQLAGKLADKLGANDILCVYAMRYGKPSIAEQLTYLKQHGATNVVVLPLYPQYSSTTTASVYDDLVKELDRWRHLPSFHFNSDYHQNEHYLEAIAESVKSHWTSHGRNEMLVMSFHGLPELLTKLGDPYYNHCQTTARLIAEKLNLNEKDWMLVFQSRFGKAEWLKPYCADTLEKLPHQGVKSIDIICPGFAVDCLETLEEIAMENKHVFLEAGGKEYRYIPALNASDAHVNVMVRLLNQWI
jgi:protoporphyrin/coproporphyrin ferrochelatase